MISLATDRSVHLDLEHLARRSCSILWNQLWLVRQDTVNQVRLQRLAHLPLLCVRGILTPRYRVSTSR